MEFEIIREGNIFTGKAFTEKKFIFKWKKVHYKVKVECHYNVAEEESIDIINKLKKLLKDETRAIRTSSN